MDIALPYSVLPWHTLHNSWKILKRTILDINLWNTSSHQDCSDLTIPIIGSIFSFTVFPIFINLVLVKDTSFANSSSQSHRWHSFYHAIRNWISVWYFSTEYWCVLLLFEIWKYTVCNLHILIWRTVILTPAMSKPSCFSYLEYLDWLPRMYDVYFISCKSTTIDIYILWCIHLDKMSIFHILKWFPQS